MDEKQYRELTPDELEQLEYSIAIIQGISDNLSRLFEEQRYVGSESQLLFRLSQQLMNRYGMMPGQPYHNKDNG